MTDLHPPITVARRHAEGSALSGPVPSRCNELSVGPRLAAAGLARACLDFRQIFAGVRRESFPPHVFSVSWSDVTCPVVCQPHRANLFRLPQRFLSIGRRHFVEELLQQ